MLPIREVRSLVRRCMKNKLLYCSCPRQAILRRADAFLLRIWLPSLSTGIGVAHAYSTMRHILLCSSDPLLTKNLYGILRDEGYDVETVEHPALAVKTVMRGAFDVLVVDSEPFGMSAEDAARIIRTLEPALPILFVGREREYGIQGARTQLDIESFKRTIHSIAV